MPNYKEKLTKERLRPTSVPGRNLALESESDKGRVIFSAPFRRLQEKAQVFSLESNAAVRSRLTHSLEVAFLGQLMAVNVLTSLEERSLLESHGLDELDTRIAFINYIETACLAHDIGNPAFGHFGEIAIRKWFEKEWESSRSDEVKKVKENASNLQRLMRDFFFFDGNAQGFRILTKTQWLKDEYSLNLTLSQLASFLKYTRSTFDDADPQNKFTKKAGYFRSEEMAVSEIRRVLEIEAGRRFPLVYLVEAADDIAYCLGDIEDGIEKGLFTEEFFRSELTSISELVRKDPEWAVSADEEDPIKCLFNDENWSENPGATADSRFAKFKVALTRDLCSKASDLYVEHHKSVFAGNEKPLLELAPGFNCALKSLKKFSRRHLYSTAEAQRPELAGYRAITGLLSHLGKLLKVDRSDFEALLREDRPDDLVHRSAYRIKSFPPKAASSVAHET